jgi:hypothetical protein
MWEPRPLTTLWVSTACYRDTFTLPYRSRKEEVIIKKLSLSYHISKCFNNQFSVCFTSRRHFCSPRNQTQISLQPCCYFKTCTAILAIPTYCYWTLLTRQSPVAWNVRAYASPTAYRYRGNIYQHNFVTARPKLELTGKSKWIRTS